MDRKTQGAEMKKLQARMAAGEFQDDELAVMLEQHASIHGDSAAEFDLGPSSVARSKSVKDDLEMAEELQRQLLAMEQRLDATSPLPEFNPMNRPSAAAGAAGAAGAADSPSRAQGTPKSRSSRRSPTASGQSVSQPMFRPQRSNRTHNAEEQIKMRRDNVSLLSNLERIQRRGGGTDNMPKKKINHVAASSINRFKGQRKVANENMAFLKRLQSVKSTGIMGSSPGRRKKTAGAPPPRGGGAAAGGRKKSKAKPEWVDIPVGPMPRV